MEARPARTSGVISAATAARDVAPGRSLRPATPFATDQNRTEVPLRPPTRPQAPSGPFIADALHGSARQSQRPQGSPVYFASSAF